MAELRRRTLELDDFLKLCRCRPAITSFQIECRAQFKRQRPPRTRSVGKRLEAVLKVCRIARRRRVHNGQKRRGVAIERGDGGIAGNLEIDTLRCGGVPVTRLAGGNLETAKKRITVCEVGKACLEHCDGVI